MLLAQSFDFFDELGYTRRGVFVFSKYIPFVAGPGRLQRLAHESKSKWNLLAKWLL